jgi:hypothetical protein
VNSCATDEVIGREAISNDRQLGRPLYVAALEVDKKRMVQRLTDARQAIQGRLHGMGPSSDNNDEKQRIEIALKNFKVP